MATSHKSSVSALVPFDTFKDDLEVNSEVAKLIDDTKSILSNENESSLWRFTKGSSDMSIAMTE